ncbi:MAG: thioredoxin domain-containing protein [Desulfobacteraceae bacterium]|nr:thioredoxin domain-containing protein [Desulfobacteraceae bacterium]
MRNIFTAGIFVIISAVVLSACAGTSRDKWQPETGQAAALMTVNHQTYTDEITSYSGPAIVIFYNNQYWQSLDMKRRIEDLAEKYEGKAKFAMFHWQISDDPSRFSLEMLPTVILYRNGEEIDRIKGIPPEVKEREKLNDDLELWFLKNALALKGSEYSGEFTYLFRNGYTLQVGNY